MKRQMQINHLRNHYSDYVFMFIKKNIDHLNRSMKILDVGAGHLRNLKLFEELGFKSLYAIDRELTDNPLSVNLKEFVLKDIQLGIPFSDSFFDITLCNYVLMFIEPDCINKVIDELLRVSNNFLIIETNKQKYKKCKTTNFQDYDFMKIVQHIESHHEFELTQVRKYHEKLIVKRK